MKSVQGADIRTNTNNPLALSEHSFGAAIDINPARNPNVPDFPLGFIEDVTGESLLMTPEAGARATSSISGSSGPI